MRAQCSWGQRDRSPGITCIQHLQKKTAGRANKDTPITSLLAAQTLPEPPGPAPRPRASAPSCTDHASPRPTLPPSAAARPGSVNRNPCASTSQTSFLRNSPLAQRPGQGLGGRRGRERGPGLRLLPQSQRLEVPGPHLWDPTWLPRPQGAPWGAMQEEAETLLGRCGSCRNTFKVSTTIHPNASSLRLGLLQVGPKRPRLLLPGCPLNPSPVDTLLLSFIPGWGDFETRWPHGGA